MNPYKLRVTVLLQYYAAGVGLYFNKQNIDKWSLARDNSTKSNCLVDVDYANPKHVSNIPSLQTK